MNNIPARNSSRCAVTRKWVPTRGCFYSFCGASTYSFLLAWENFPSHRSKSSENLSIKRNMLNQKPEIYADYRCFMRIYSCGKGLDFIFRTFHSPIFHKFSRFPIVSLIFTICCYSVRYVLLIESKSLLMLNFSCDLIYARFQDENLKQSLLHCLRIHRFVPRISSRIPYCAKIYARRRNVSHWNLMRLKYFSSS